MYNQFLNLKPQNTRATVAKFEGLITLHTAYQYRLDYLNSPQIQATLSWASLMLQDILDVAKYIDSNQPIKEPYNPFIEFETEHWNYWLDITDDVDKLRLDFKREIMKKYIWGQKRIERIEKEIKECKENIIEPNKPEPKLEDLEALVSNSNIEEVLLNLGVKIVKKGMNHLCYSPFRDEKTPSFHVHSQNGLWFDFGSGEGGNIFKLIQLITNCNFIESIKFIKN